MWLPTERVWPSILVDGVHSLPPAAVPWDGIGPFPRFNGRIIPKGVEDQLGIWGTGSGITRLEAWNELQKIIPTLPLEPDYRAWLNLVPMVQRRLWPTVQASASRRLFARVAAEYSVPDPYVLEFILSTIATVSIPGDPVWGFIVGPPSSLKTELLRWTSKSEPIYSLSKMTPHSLVSGLRDGQSLLPELDGSTLVVKDFTAVLEMDKKARDEIFSQLRDAFDGYFEAHFGSVGKLSYHSHFHVLAGVTSAIEDYYSVQSFLGPRFLKVRVPDLDGFDRAIAQGGREDELRAEFEGLVSGALKNIGTDAWKEVAFPRVAELRPIAELLARGRTHVSRYDGSISAVPEPEKLPRLTKQLRKLAIGRALIYGRREVDNSDISFVQRVALDTLPRVRSDILRTLIYAKEAAQIGYFIKLPRTTTARHLEDLEALELVAGDGGKPELFRLIGPAAAVFTPQFFGQTSSASLPKEKGGELGAAIDIAERRASARAGGADPE